MYKTIFKKIILLVISLNLIIVQPLSAATGIGANERTSDLSIEMIKSGEPSDLPIAGVEDFFEKEHFSFIENFDLSSYLGKQIFVGYGIYDVNQENCKYLEVPGISENDFNLVFTKYGKYNLHSYGLVSMAGLSFSSCQTIANNFGGEVVVIDDRSENGYVANRFLETGETAWVGATADTNCFDYTNELSRNQEFFNWKDNVESNSLCGNTSGTLGSEANIFLKKNRKWEKGGAGALRRCIIEWDSEDFKRPIKVCAPWWRVVREFKNEGPNLYDTDNLKRINKAELPVQIHMCVEYEADVTTVPMDDDAGREVTCTTYYDRTAAEECVRDLLQPQCYVDECGGYIRNVCTEMDEDIVGKGYIKGQVLLDGTMESVKIKDKVTTHFFNCPASVISHKKCLTKGLVVVYPQECPPAQCTSLKDCLQTVTATNYSTRALRKDAEKVCYDTYHCEKKYPTLEIQPQVINGVVTEMYGKCDDGSSLTFIPNIMSKDIKRCLRYEEVPITENFKKKCVTERPFTEVSVNLGFTDSDDYQDNPNCIRLDTANESQEKTATIFKFTEKGYFSHKITKVNFDNSSELVYKGGSDGYVLSAAIDSVSMDLQESASPSNPIDNTEIEVVVPAGSSATTIEETDADGNTETHITGSTPLVDCSTYDPSSASFSSWYTKNREVFFDASLSLNSDIYQSTELISGSSGTIQIKDIGSIISTDAKCRDYASDHGFGAYQTSYSWSQTEAGENSCSINLNLSGLDSEMKEIKFYSLNEIKYVFSNNMTGSDCRNKAICLNGLYDTSKYPSLSDIDECTVVVDGSGYPESYMDDIKDENGISRYDPSTEVVFTDGNCQPLEPGEISAGTSVDLDSIESIVVLEDFLDGGFGYYSNFNSWYSKDNRVKVSFDSFVDKRTFPFIETAKINDVISYHFQIWHISYLKKEPDVGLAAGAAAGAGVMTALMMVLMCIPIVGWIIAAIVVIVFALIMLLGPPKKMDNQFMVWIIYKDVLASDYIEGPYEKRILMVPSHIELYKLNKAHKGGGSSSLFSVTPSYKLMYLTSWYTSNTDERDPFLKYINQKHTAKNGALTCAGFTQSAISNSMSHLAETTTIWGYPSCEWYRPWCTKSSYRDVVTETRDVVKEMTNVYLGAVNTMVILLPYAGDYKIQGYDKYDELLAENTIHKDTFVQAGGVDNLKFAKVNFGLIMQPSTQMKSDATTIVSSSDTMGETSGACRADPMVEWGGGVSGIYYESGTTGISSSACFKSDDLYVKDRSMVKIKVTPLNLEDGFEYVLTKPMPYPNRIFLSTMDKLSKRDYRCYEDYPDCSDTDFEEVQ